MMDRIRIFLELFGNNSQNLSAVDAFMSLSNFSNETFTLDINRQHTFGLVGSVLMVLAYGTLILISLFGNAIVCYVILRNRRMYTVTNFFIANMALSDLFVTCFNVPFNIVRNLSHEWSFGHFLCHLVNFSLMTSVYVSTFTLTAIALDRQYVLLYPLRPRMSKAMGIAVLIVIWIVSLVLSLPYGIYTEVKEVFFVIEKVRRCRSAFPEPSDTFEKVLTICTTTLQYVIPLTVIAIAYGRIVRKLWLRTHLGAVTRTQQLSQAKAKRRSIKLLITVVVIFALCWMPLNLYHILTDFHPDPKVFRYDSTTFFVLHWLAISSTCYNPFVYCWMNETFRNEVKACFMVCKKTKKIHPGVEYEGMLMRSDIFSRTRNKTISSVLRSSAFASSIRGKKSIMCDSSLTVEDRSPLFAVQSATTKSSSPTPEPENVKQPNGDVQE